MSVAQLETIVERLQHSASVRSVYGQPIERGGRTVVPIAEVAYAFGGGYGRGEPTDEKSGNSASAGQGGGGGGYATAKPVGALEITDDETRFVRADGNRKLAVALGALALGVAVGRASRSD
ncbi:GerW family sporulation protein [Halorussus halophilus]|uniref:GerW family sporulation protein n=1 Tax=Halorussus halophilus TaxID=2650975 RepID=UPI001301470D|nr:spore germination protein GerW family protein [Halorussus halophilus]